MENKEQNIREQIIEQYTKDVEKLVRYLPWLHKVKGSDVESAYEGEGKETLIRIPVYDSTLLAFVKEAGNTQFMTKNYPYVYTRYRIKSPEMERTLLREAKIQDIDIFKGILSKYVLEGRRRSDVWRIAVEEEIFATALESLNMLFFRKKE